MLCFTLSANEPHKLFGSYLVLVLLHFLIFNKPSPIRRKISIQTSKMHWMPMASIKHFRWVQVDVRVLFSCGFLSVCSFVTFFNVILKKRRHFCSYCWWIRLWKKITQTEAEALKPTWSEPKITSLRCKMLHRQHSRACRYGNSVDRDLGVFPFPTFSHTGEPIPPGIHFFLRCKIAAFLVSLSIVIFGPPFYQRTPSVLPPLSDRASEQGALSSIPLLQPLALLFNIPGY